METSCEPAGADVGALQRWAGQGDDGERGGTVPQKGDIFVNFQLF